MEMGFGCYSIKQVMELTSLSRPTLWRLRKTGMFPAPVTIIPGRVLFLRQDIHDWIKRGVKPEDAK